MCPLEDLDNCNKFKDDITTKGTPTSSDIIHTYTNILACLATTAEDKSSAVPRLTEFKRKVGNLENIDRQQHESD